MPNDQSQTKSAAAVASSALLAAPREFFVEVDSLLSWVAHRGWVIRDPEDRETAERLQRQARAIYESADRKKGPTVTPGDPQLESGSEAYSG